MNYISAKEAVKLCGYSLRTMLRLMAKEESKPYMDQNSKIYRIDADYLLSKYPVFKKNYKKKFELAKEEVEILRRMIAEKNKEIEKLRAGYNPLPIKQQEQKKKGWWSV